MLKVLKIAVSALSLAACLALVALWGRSYPAHDNLEGPISSSRHFTAQSFRGRLALATYPTRFASRQSHAQWQWRVLLPDPATINERRRNAPHWGVLPGSYGEFGIKFPHWFPTLIFAMLAAAPWLKWRFSVRTLLIGMTIVAVILGVAVATN